jgi:glutathione S-transferase
MNCRRSWIIWRPWSRATTGFLVGDSLTLADIAVASPFANFGHLGCEHDRGRHGRTCAYIERILARPSFASWIERETAFLARTAA